MRWLAAVGLASVSLLAQALQPGSPLPSFEGESLSGKTISLPGASAGKPTLLVFSFSKEGGEKSTPWMNAWVKEYGSGDRIAYYSVAMLEAAPRLIRGLIRSGMKKGMPPAIQDRSVLLYKDDKVWRTRLGVTKDDAPFVVLLDAKGQVQTIRTGAYDSALAEAIRSKLSDLR
jgi:hypothetical protein